MTFDGSGHYTYIGQLLTGINAAVSQTSLGVYLLDAGGFLVLDSPLRTGAKLNARFAAEAIVGSSTESSDNSYDLFVAIPAPAGGAVFTGPYHCMSLNFRRRSSPICGAPSFHSTSWRSATCRHFPSSATQPAFRRDAPDPTDDRRHLYHGCRRTGQHHGGSRQQCTVAQWQPDTLPFDFRQYPAGRFHAAGGYDIDRREGSLRRLERHGMPPSGARASVSISMR